MGDLSIAPADPSAKMTRAYRGHTLILEIDARDGGGVAIVTDSWPTTEGRNLVCLVRHNRAPVELCISSSSVSNDGAGRAMGAAVDDGPAGVGATTPGRETCPEHFAEGRTDAAEFAVAAGVRSISR